MKKIILLSSFLLSLIMIGHSSRAQTSVKAAPVKKIMTFDQSYIELGKVKRGEKRKFSFTFTNTGDEDIVIDLVSACECTTTDYPVLPIKPGKKGEIKVVFDSTEKEASETIDVDIYLQNTDEKGNPILEIVQYNYELIQ